MNVLAQRFVLDRAAAQATDAVRDAERVDRMSEARELLAQASIVMSEVDMALTEVQSSASLLTTAATSAVAVEGAVVRAQLEEVSPNGELEALLQTQAEVEQVVEAQEAVRDNKELQERLSFGVEHGHKILGGLHSVFGVVALASESAKGAAGDALASAQAGRFDSRQSLSTLAAMARDARKV